MFAAALAAAGVGPGIRLLDAGCGSGIAAGMAAELGAAVHGLDASDEMVAIARHRVPAAVFVNGDLQSLPYADGTFDVVTGFNSFQFAAEPAAALAEARRVVRPGGRLVIVTWAPPAGMPAAAVISALRTLLPPAPPGAPGPFALSDEAALRAFAEQAGLRAEGIFDVACPFAYPDAETALRGLCSSGIAERARQVAGDAAVAAAYRAAIAPYLGPDGRVHIEATFRGLIAFRDI
jgi:SAM-dependent methyltransferase